MSLEYFRMQIDMIDSQILELFAKRFNAVNEIGKIKKTKNMQALDEKRWKEVLQKVAEKGENLGLNKDFVVSVWEEIHKESLEIER